MQYTGSDDKIVTVGMNGYALRRINLCNKFLICVNLCNQWQKSI